VHGGSYDLPLLPLSYDDVITLPAAMLAVRVALGKKEL